MQKVFNWSKLGAVAAGVAIVVAGGAPFLANNNVDNIQSQIDDLSEKIQVDEDGNIINVAETEVIVDEDAITNQDIYDELVEDDMFETSVELLANDETDKRGFLGDLAEILPNLERKDYKDITKISVRDTTTTIIDREEGEATVELKLRVTYDSDSDSDVRETVNVIFDIEDNEIEDVDISVEE